MNLNSFSPERILSFKVTGHVLTSDDVSIRPNTDRNACLAQGRIIVQSIYDFFFSLNMFFVKFQYKKKKKCSRPPSIGKTVCMRINIRNSIIIVFEKLFLFVLTNRDGLQKQTFNKTLLTRETMSLYNLLPFW